MIIKAFGAVFYERIDSFTGFRENTSNNITYWLYEAPSESAWSSHCHCPKIHFGKLDERISKVVPNYPCSLFDWYPRATGKQNVINFTNTYNNYIVVAFGQLGR